jgi:predicted acylesterase/phospholipase RssA
VTSVEPHTPALAAGSGSGAPRRSLLLAGGGMRVAYQAGVLAALERAGIRFAHGDGTSGGTMNLAMLFSGLSPAQISERWRTLDVRGFVSLWSPRRLLAGPPYPALGSSNGIRDRVFPHLGIAPERIRAARGIVGTFNVCDYESKRCVAIPHDQIDLDLLVAGVSLPMLSPAVRRQDRAYVDAVWITDANVAEAVGRGADELWLVWAIGNHGVYRNGVFQQYVHMIEMSANGSLFKALDTVRALNASRPEPIRLHVIRPRSPLPLDPDLFLGRIDASTLVAMGHRDACRYLASPAPQGIALDSAATRMEDPRPGVAFRETLRAHDGAWSVRLSWEIEDLDRFAADGTGSLVGDVSHPHLGERVLACDGSFRRRGRRWDGELRLPDGRLVFTRSQRHWPTVDASLLDSAGAEVAAGALAVTGRPAWQTVHARGVGSMTEGAAAVTRFTRLAVLGR